jgi:Peptidase S46
LFEGGAEAISGSDDPLIVLARKVEPIVRELRAWNEENIQNIEAGAGEKIANARFAVYGKTVYPDANFNLRIEYGTVSSYEEDTTLVPFKTTFYGLFDRAASFNEKPPYHLPPRWKDAKTKLNLTTPLNFVYSADTIGGNSGSPVINRNAEIVGINFDSNIQKLPNRYLYIDESEGARAVGVHTAAVIESLLKLYGAGKLVEEIRGK